MVNSIHLFTRLRILYLPGSPLQLSLRVQVRRLGAPSRYEPVLHHPDANNDLLIFPRFIFDYYKYVSSVGMIRVNIEKLLSSDVETPIESKIILWPVNLWEFLGCEDPRAFRAYGSYYMFYTSKGYFLEGREYIRMDVLGLAEYDDKWRLKRRGYFTITHGEEKFTPKSNKDGAFIKTQSSKFTLLTRPEIKDNRICWRGLADIKAMEIEAESLEPVLVFEDWELKVGWSRPAAEGLTKGHGYVFGNPFGLIAGPGPLGHRSYQRQ